MACDRSDLVRAAASLSKPSSGSLAQTMRAASVQASHPALVPKPISKTPRGVRLAVLGEGKRQIAGGLFGDDRCQCFVNGYPDGATGFLLADDKHAVRYVLPPHGHDIRSPLAGIEQQGEREPRARANR